MAEVISKPIILDETGQAIVKGIADIVKILSYPDGDEVSY